MTCLSFPLLEFKSNISIFSTTSVRNGKALWQVARPWTWVCRLGLGPENLCSRTIHLRDSAYMVASVLQVNQVNLGGNDTSRYLMAWPVSAIASSISGLLPGDVQILVTSLDYWFQSIFPLCIVGPHGQRFQEWSSSRLMESLRNFAFFPILYPTPWAKLTGTFSECLHLAVTYPHVNHMELYDSVLSPENRDKGINEIFSLG